MSMLDSPNFSATFLGEPGGKRKATACRMPPKAERVEKKRDEKPVDGAPSHNADRTDNGAGATGDPLAAEPPGDMRREEDRLATFSNWKVPFMNPAEMAANGFYYFGRGDEVRCAFCRVEIGFWEDGDEPAVDHERWAPQCPILRRRPSGNVPLPNGLDECGTRAAPKPPGMMTPQSGIMTVPPDSAAVATSTGGPTHPRYASVTSRLRSFMEWPRSMRQKPADLADAGFYYTGQGDKTICFYCGGGLKDWEDEDNPWEQHARWFGRCAYVLLNKGGTYVQKVNNSLAPTPACDGSPSVPIKELSNLIQPEEQEPKVTDNSIGSESGTSKDDRNLCKICYSEERDVCFIPCGHVVSCSKCALSTSNCPMCRRPFTSTVRLFYS